MSCGSVRLCCDVNTKINLPPALPTFVPAIYIHDILYSYGNPVVDKNTQLANIALKPEIKMSGSFHQPDPGNLWKPESIQIIYFLWYVAFGQVGNVMGIRDRIPTTFRHLSQFLFFNPHQFILDRQGI